MTPKTKKIITFVIPIVVVILVTVLIVLYLTTDFLKSNKKLFLKYMSQNIDAFKIAIDNKSEKEYTNILKQNKYESTMELKAEYTENISTSKENKKNDINKLRLESSNQSDYLNNYEYKDFNLDYNESNLLRAEYIHDGDIYGIRFPNKFNQFLAVENNNLKQVASNAGLEEEQVALIPDKIEEFNYNEVLSFTDEEILTIQNKYLNILSNNISKNNYSKQKDAMITIGENSIYTTAYSITLNQEQANDIYIKILEELKSDEIIIKKLSLIEPIGIIFNTIKQDENSLNNKYLEEKYVQIIDEKIEEIKNNNIGISDVKCTVYQKNGITVRTQLVEESKQITIDYNKTDNDNIEFNIQNKTSNQEQENESKIKILKNKENQKNNFSINIENNIADEISTIEIYRNKDLDETSTTIETGIKYNDGKDNLLELTLSEDALINDTFERNIELDRTNSVITNNYEKENVSFWVSQVKEYLVNTCTENQAIITNIEKIPTIGKIFGKSQETIVTETNTTTDVEKNRFNSKFEFYTGKEKKSEEVIKMLEENKVNFNGAQVSYSNEGNTEKTKKLQSIRIEVANEANKPELVESIKEMIEKNKTYTIEVEKDSNDIVNSIIITLNK